MWTHKKAAFPPWGEAAFLFLPSRTTDSCNTPLLQEEWILDVHHDPSAAVLTPLPDTVRDSWGEQVAHDFSRWLEASVEERTGHRDEFCEILSRLNVLEARFDQVDERLDRMEDHLNDRFEQADKRFEQVDERFERVDERFAQMNDQLDRTNGRILSMTRWPIGLLALFETLVTALLSVSQFTG